jgi:large subunit ribosomal protein L35
LEAPAAPASDDAGKARFGRHALEKIVFSDALCHNPALLPPGRKGCRGGRNAQANAQIEHNRPAFGLRRMESQMPKLKNKSGAKKRFKVTGTGKVVYAQRGKRHGMIKRTKKQIRQLRGTAILFKTDGETVKKNWLPAS